MARRRKRGAGGPLYLRASCVGRGRRRLDRGRHGTSAKAQAEEAYGTVVRDATDAGPALLGAEDPVRQMSLNSWKKGHHAGITPSGPHRRPRAWGSYRPARASGICLPRADAYRSRISRSLCRYQSTSHVSTDGPRPGGARLLLECHVRRGPRRHEGRRWCWPSRS